MGPGKLPSGLRSPCPHQSGVRCRWEAVAACATPATYIPQVSWAWDSRGASTFTLLHSMAGQAQLDAHRACSLALPPATVKPGCVYAIASLHSRCLIAVLSWPERPCAICPLSVAPRLDPQPARRLLATRFRGTLTTPHIHPSNGMPAPDTCPCRWHNVRRLDAPSYNIRFPRVPKSCGCHCLTMDHFSPVSARASTVVRREPAELPQTCGHSRTWQASDSDMVYEIRLCEHPLEAPFNGRWTASVRYQLASSARCIEQACQIRGSSPRRKRT